MGMLDPMELNLKAVESRMWVLGIEAGPLEELSVLLTVETSLQPQISYQYSHLRTLVNKLLHQLLFLFQNGMDCSGLTKAALANLGRLKTKLIFP